jgi:hypothetical protein
MIRVTTLPIPIQHILEFLTRAIRQEEETKGIQRGNVVKLSLYTGDMILYLKDLKKLHPKCPRHHKQLQQSSRIQNQLAKINTIFINQQ